jgi:hypothetical protein
MARPPLNLFPTFSTLPLETPNLLLRSLDRAGQDAAQRFDAVLDAAGVPVAQPHSADETTLRAAVRAFERALWDSADVPRAVRRSVARKLPLAWDRITRDARDGVFSSAVLLLEADERNRDDKDNDRADADQHPVTAYLDRAGQDAAREAFAAHAAALREGSGDEQAHKAAESAFRSALAKAAAGDVVEWLRELDDKGFWVVAATAAAGLLASFVIAPRTLLRSAASLGLDPLPISADFDVATIDGGVKVRVGAGVTALLRELAEATTWQHVFRHGLGAQAWLSLDFGAGKLTARVSVSEGTWGVRIGFSGAFA